MKQIFQEKTQQIMNTITQTRFIISAVTGIIGLIIIIALIQSTSAQSDKHPKAAADSIKAQNTSTPTTSLSQKETDTCEGDDCQYTEDILYSKAWDAAKHIVQAQNAYITINPEDAEAMENNGRIIDKYLTGQKSYEIDKDGKRLMSTMRRPWIASTALAAVDAKWILPDNNEETKNNSLKERGITIFCVAKDGTVLSYAFLGWAESSSPDELDQLKSDTYNNPVVDMYLDNEYLAFNRYSIIYTPEGTEKLNAQ